MPANAEMLSSEPPSCRTLCIRNADAVPKPVLYVIVPSQLPFDRDVAILQVKNIHDLGDSEVSFSYFNLTVLPALLEGVHDSWAIILATAWGDCAQRASLVHASIC